MGDHGVGHTAFKRINKFNDDKTEQVWELFREEFARASVAEDGETSWRCAAGIMSVDDINKQITEEDAATVISDIASSSSSSIQVTASWIENKDDKTYLKSIEYVRDMLPAVRWAPVVLVSALTGQRCPKIYDAIDEAVASHRRKVFP